MVIRYGDLGRAISPMSPSGVVEVNGERIDARSESGFVEVGSHVIVLRGDPIGYVIRKFDPNQTPPKLPNHGELIPRPEFQRNTAEVAEVDRQDRTETRRRLLKGLQYGSIAAASLGAAVGLVSGGTGWYFGWGEVVDPASRAMLLGASSAVGAVAGVVLFFITGMIGSVLGIVSDGDAGFAPDFFTVFAALVGAAVGFWMQFGSADAGTIALWSVGVAAGFAVISYVLAWLAGKILESVVGV